ncbi:hypothetical protein [Zavarzinella formosa]|uniref:hypothetical protein n=1 Tax=Zavarzinella formosa TaxID=360055 RepID=UPI0002E11C9C|nr:hypothetical protein [Zavarzinella formosa]
MSVTLYESVKSRGFEISTDSSSFTGEFLAVGSDDHEAVYAAVLQQTPLSFFGLYRKSASCKPRGGPYWDVSVGYASIPASEALGQQDSGSEQPPPDSPQPDDSLKSGFSFTTSGGTQHITQSLQTISSTGRTPVGGVGPPTTPPDYKQAIGVTRDSVEGVDIISRTNEFSREIHRGAVTLRYLNTLFKLTGTVNIAPFYGRAPGEVLYLGADGQFGTGEGWSITHKWGVSPNKVNIKISDEITVPAKYGWEYLWVAYTEQYTGGRKVRIPMAAYVERVYEYGDLSGLEIGT